MTPCEWPVSYSECKQCTALTNLTPEEQARIESMAVDFLWRWSGRRFGLCNLTIRPCKKIDYEWLSTYTGGDPNWIRMGIPGFRAPFMPYLFAGQWFNLGCGRCGDGACGCSRTPSISLPGPVDAITEVVIDGTVLDPAAYRVDNYRYLARTDGGEWPTCQDLSKPSAPGSADAEGTWQVSYQRGTAVPVGGEVAAGLLACELAKAMCGDSSCKLPQRVQSITRQGVTVAVLDTFDDIDKGRTGIWLIDSWIASVTKAPQRSRVYSPDVPRTKQRRQTWP